VRGFSIENLFLRFPQPEAHTRQVTRLAFSLYDQLSPLHGLGAWERELLAAAARLHDIGSAINYYDHHKHGEYLINGGALPGFFHREQALIALTVRYHRKGTPKVLGYGPVLRKGDARRLLVLATCLRLAEMLERSRAGRVQDVEATLRDGTVTVTLLARENPQVGLWEAAKQARLFQQAFDRRLDLQVRLRG
jgi:exopolyphosphatase/guanosine-5'-triphosphate,3'-diphosphate pyrophosphatase